MVNQMTKSTRDRILSTILERNRCTINDLAEAVGINPISVRHHIIKLEALGLVSSEEERNGVGRPPKVYFLTEDGLEKFPTRYLLLTNRLLHKLKSTVSEAAVSQLLIEIAEDVAAEYVDQVDMVSLPMEKRLDILKDLLTKEGFIVDWERAGDHYLVHEISCPYFRVGENHPEVCSVDETLISNLLMVPTQRVNCVLSGDSHCTYEISAIEEFDLEKAA
jgi:predicted ArsR family transcriptional regulator